MIKSSQLSLQWSNDGKRQLLNDFIKVYSEVVSDFVDVLWNIDNFPTCLPKSITDKVDRRGLSARALQCAGKQAGAIVKGTKSKHKRRLYILDKLKKDNDLEGVGRIEGAIEKNPFSKPVFNRINPELDSRFCKIETNSDNSFELWLTLSSLGKKYGKLCLPFQKHRHFNKMFDKGNIKSGIRLSSKKVTFMFDLPDVPERKTGETLGIDIGKTTVISLSNGHQSKPNKHGHDLNSITGIICRRKRGSKGFERAVRHRENYINWSINQINFDGVKTVIRENLKNMRRGRSVGKTLFHWTYPAIFDKLDSRCSELGVLIKSVTPTYTSQRCHRCGFTKKSNRKGESFKCYACGYTANADLNASLNIALCLSPSGVDRQSKLNRTGFYWFDSGQEPIVPVVKKP